MAEKLSWVTKGSYSAGGLAISLMAETPAFFLNTFLLSVASMDASSAGTLLLISKIWDAFTDPLIGTLTDKTRSRWGRRRPWILLGGPLCALANGVLWQTFPILESDAQKFGYYLCAFCLLTFGMTCVAIPFAALAMEISIENEHRVTLNKYRVAMQCVGMMVGVAIVTACLLLTGDDEARGYSISSMVISPVILVGTTLCFLGTRETSYHLVDLGPPSHLPFLEGAKLIFWNFPFVTLLFLSSCGWVSTSLAQNNLIFYFRYSLDLDDYYAYSLLLILGCAILAVPLWEIMISKFGKKMVFLAGNLLLLLVYVCLLIVPKGNLAFVLVLSVLCGIALAVIQLCPWAMIPDVIDLDELKTGKRREGIFCAFLVFFQKIGIGLALSFSGYMIDLGGFDDDNETQPDSLDLYLRLLMGAIPGGITLLALVFLYIYPITTSIHTQNSEDLKAFRAERERGEESQRDRSKSELSMHIHEDSPLISKGD